jgi:hypothetical protein
MLGKHFNKGRKFCQSLALVANKLIYKYEISYELWDSGYVFFLDGERYTLVTLCS